MIHNGNNEEEKSKSQVKRELHALQDLGKQLIELSPKQLQAMPLSEPLREAVLQAKSFSRRALQRQLKYIGGLMPHEDVDAIYRALDGLLRPHRQQVQAFHETEQWRDKLIAGDEALLNELVDRFNADRQHLRQLVRNAQKEQAQNKPPRSARVLFQYLTELQNRDRKTNPRIDTDSHL